MKGVFFLMDQRKAKVISGAKSILETREFKVVSEGYNSDEGVYDILGEKSKTGAKSKKEKIIVRVPDEDPVGVQTLRDFQEHRASQKIEHAILLALTKYTHYTKKEAQKNNIEIFSIKFPFFDLFQHVLVPTMAFATEEEKADLIEKYSIDLKQLPKILAEDPSAQLLGAKVGDVVKIVRDSATAGAYTTYRYCIE